MAYDLNKYYNALKNAGIGALNKNLKDAEEVKSFLESEIESTLDNQLREMKGLKAPAGYPTRFELLGALAATQKQHQDQIKELFNPDNETIKELIEEDARKSALNEDEFNKKVANELRAMQDFLLRTLEEQHRQQLAYVRTISGDYVAEAGLDEVKARYGLNESDADVTLSTGEMSEKEKEEVAWHSGKFRAGFDKITVAKAVDPKTGMDTLKYSGGSTIFAGPRYMVRDAADRGMDWISLQLGQGNLMLTAQNPVGQLNPNNDPALAAAAASATLEGIGVPHKEGGVFSETALKYRLDDFGKKYFKNYAPGTPLDELQLKDNASIPTDVKAILNRSTIEVRVDGWAPAARYTKMLQEAKQLRGLMEQAALLEAKNRYAQGQQLGTKNTFEPPEPQAETRADADNNDQQPNEQPGFVVGQRGGF